MTESAGWRFYRIGIFVTGEGESRFLPVFLRALTTDGRCTFRVVRRVPQLSPITSAKVKRKMVGSGKSIQSVDEEIGGAARRWLQEGADRLLIVVDDLEHDRREQRHGIFARYRAAIDTMCAPELRARASVHFLVNMLEAYYFANTAAVNAVLGTSFADFQGDVEDIRHPKNDLKALARGFDEVAHGARIVATLDLERVLDDGGTCGSLRVLFAWCATSVGSPIGPRFQLDSGVHDVVTGPQLDR